ncbi:cytochrome C [Aquiflexum sp.]|uniref:cytochrome C n=1 Tax=Aquiflexum sp. TaxID=1872584 RepID=UPI00359371FD
MEDDQWKKLMVAMAGLTVFLLVIMGSMIAFLIILHTNPDLFYSQKEPPQLVQETFQEDELIEDGVHMATGFVEGEGLMMVVNNCTNCHSAKLVTQNRFTKEGWIQVIRWMQETQGLWDLGPNEAVIVEYLSKHYAPEPRGRRKPLEVEWYSLEE